MIPASLAWLFWEVDPATIDLEHHRDYVLERIMTRGDWLAMRWLIAHTEKPVLAEFLARRADHLSPRDRAFWSLVAGITAPATPGGGRPSWAG